MIESSCLFWEGVPADHALLGVVVRARMARKRTRKKTWQCKDEEKCIRWIQQHAPVKFATASDVHEFVGSAQCEFDENLTCAQRRFLRLPSHLREMYRTLAETEDEDERRRLQRQAWDLRKSWVAAWKTRCIRDTAAKGKVISRSKKLHQLEALTENDGSRMNDSSRWEEALGRHFGDKWGTSNAAVRTQLMEQVVKTDGAELVVPSEGMLAAFRAIRRKRKLDNYGVSVGVLLLLWLAVPSLFMNFIVALITSVTMMSSIEVKGCVFGKESRIASVNKVRAILPLPALLQVVDALLPILFEQHLASLLPTPPGCLVGGRPFTQVLDISHGIQCVLEKGLDDFGAAAAAQSDIQQFYDSLPIMLILQWMISKGIPAVLACAAIRHQVCPHVILVAGYARVSIRDRCIGGLTGSRVAGMLARIPVESSLLARAAHWKNGDFP